MRWLKRRVGTRTTARQALDEAEKLLHQVAGEVLYQAGFMGHGRLRLAARVYQMALRSVWDLGPAAEKLARKCLKLLDSSLASLVSHVTSSFKSVRRDGGT